MKEKACVVIPIYKSSLTSDEKDSFERCLKILGSHPISIFTFKKLDLSNYEEIAQKYGVSIIKKYFAPKFFDGIKGYNKLVRNYKFYKTYENYEFILIYQLDAWVFSDSLLHWCQKDYDYIGAPWCKKNEPPTEDNPFVLSGNGGFSLRKTQWFINVLSSKKKIFTPKGIQQKIQGLENQNGIKKTIRLIGYKTGILNRIFTINNSSRLEDWFWIENFANTDSFFPLSVPKPEISMFFAFEQWGGVLYEKTKGVLPFGAHAYKKYQYNEFWKNHIETQK